MDGVLGLRGPLGLLDRVRRGAGGGLKTKEAPRPIAAPVLVPTGPPEVGPTLK